MSLHEPLQPPRELAELQRRFWRLLVAPQGVERTLPTLAAAGDAAAEPERWIVAADRDEAVWRLDIYANMYFFRLLDILKADYPTLLAYLGDAHFHNLVTDYLVAQPPNDASVRHLGAALPSYLQTHALIERFPAAADLARLEWTQSLLVDRADERPLSAAQLQALPPVAWAELALQSITAFELLTLDYPVHRLWRAVEDGEPLPTIAAEQTHIVVWRRGYMVHHRTVQTDEATLLRALGAGLPFGELCEELAAVVGEEAAVQGALTFLQRWLGEEMLRDTLVQPESASPEADIHTRS